MKNICVSLISAKHYNQDTDVALVTNLKETEAHPEYSSLLREQGILWMTCPFDSFAFPADFKWSLAFYKLCALEYLSKLDYDYISYIDGDVYVQGSFEVIWQECTHNIMLYDINHGPNTPDYQKITKTFQEFLGTDRHITHYGGEFFAATRENALEILGEMKKVYHKMRAENYITNNGDEFILSIAADCLKIKVKNAGAYIFRFWSSAGFRLVSTCYQYNRVILLHVPAEKQNGMIRLYHKYVAKKTVHPIALHGKRCICHAYKKDRS